MTPSNGPMRIVLLGAGRVGGAIARDLAAGGEFHVTVVDRDPAALSRLDGTEGISVQEADLADAREVQRVVRDHEMVVGAVPGLMGFATLRTVLEAGKNVVDISFFAEDPFLLDGLARERGLTALVDCGVAPGCSNLILGRLEDLMDSTTRFECLVGGLPAQPEEPFAYKAPFSPIDVIEEYMRPARIRRDGSPETVPALSEVESVDFPGVGVLEAFYTDGVRSLLDTTDTPTLIEKTLRYPGHAEQMRVFREMGLFGTDPIEVGGVTLRPLDLTASLLFEAWRYEEGEEDLTAMRVTVDGEQGGHATRHVYQMLDRYDRSSGTSSMSRTTGYTCTAMVRMVARGLYTEVGVSPPELVGRRQACFDFVMSELADRGVTFEHREERLNAPDL